MRIADVTVMFDYLYWVRDRVLAAAAKLSEEAFLSTDTVTSRDLRATLVHELDVEWSWRQRLHPSPAEAFDPDAELRAEDYPTVQALVDHWHRDESEMRAWLGTLTDDELASPPPDERAAETPLWVFLIHM